MTAQQIKELKDKQNSFFLSGKTLDVSFRLQALQKLYNGIKKYEEQLRSALLADLGKSAFEADMCEIYLTLSEITYLLKHTRRYAKGRKVRTNLANAVASSSSRPSPYGNVLIMSPWNYPVLLALEPLADALSAGNTCIIKPSAYSPETTKVLEALIHDTFSEDYVAVVTGGREENSALLEEHFDYIFFTGSKSVGKLVMEKASKHLTPVTLELGGKSPVIVDKTADLKLTARRLVFGKYLNCGQTCVAPDYVLVHSAVKYELISEIKKEIVRQYGEKPLNNPNFGKIINQKHFERILGLIDPEKVAHGGASDASTLKIEPTVLDNISLSDPVMQQEIFGPVMPIITFSELDEAISIIRGMEHPLAFYVFSNDKDVQNHLMSSIGFGGGCINDTIIHLATSNMGFGGFGESGMGQYHGKTGFDTFSHYKSIVDRATWIDVPLRYQPYKDFFHKVVRWVLK